MEKIRIIIDTNWWISFVISRFKNKLSLILQDNRFDIITSKELTEEIFTVLGKNTFLNQYQKILSQN
jgi:predicted nucleic acid-binding protein